MVFLDEGGSTSRRWHPILSVGGVMLDTDHLCEVEEIWRNAKRQHDLEGHDLRFGLKWPGGPKQRMEMIQVVGTLPLRAVAALLEDFRPLHMRVRKPTRADLYVHEDAFKYVLQRLCAPQYAASGGNHMVVFDHGDHFRKLDEQYRQCHGQPWGDFGFPSLRNVGYSESLTAACGGPMVEIADLVLGSLTRWAMCRCAVEAGKDVPERQELDRACAAVIGHFPVRDGGMPLRRRGWSVVVHTGNLTGKDMLRDHIDGWIRELPG